MPNYKLKTYSEHSMEVNESILLAMLLPVLVVASGKILGYAIGSFGGFQIKKSMDNLIKSRFVENAKDSDIKKLYDLIVKEYPEIKAALDKDDNVKLTSDMKNAGLDKDAEASLNDIIDKLRKYHKSQS